MIKRACAYLFAFFGLCACSAATPPPPDCQTQNFSDAPFIVCSFDPATRHIRLFHKDAEDDLIGQFEQLVTETKNDGTLVFAMNAGMYHDDRSPVGLYVERGETLSPIVLAEGPGNFGMRPNGVFWLGADGTAGVTESTAFAAPETQDVWYATQSGPMLVIDGALHPAFNVDGTSRKRRNGVGVDADGRVYFAISDVPVNFHTFARLFRDHLGVPNALYLDGQISKVYAPELDRHEKGLDMGPMVGVTGRKANQ